MSKLIELFALPFFAWAVLVACEPNDWNDGDGDGDGDVDGDGDADGDGDGDCEPGSACDDPCARARASSSYEGCEYRAVTLMNSEVDREFVPAVAVSNQNDEVARVRVTRGGSSVGEAMVEPRSTRTISIPWVDELKGAYDEEQSVNVADGSYLVTSDLPVTVYQFNPLEYRLDHDCAAEEGDYASDGVCYSYSNDASLLLPVHVLTEHYIVMSRATFGMVNHWASVYEASDRGDEYYIKPGIFTIVNPQDSEVSVDIAFSGPTQAGPGLDAYEAGQSGTFAIAPGGVLQIASRVPDTCTPDFVESASYDCGTPPYESDYQCTDGYCELAQNDLTGTEISASAPVAVFGGHNCTFIPYNRWACDHVEEQLFPFESWGQHFVVNQSRRENGEPDLLRIVSGADGTTVRFDPGAVHGDVTLDRGQFVEFEVRGAVDVQADGPVLVGQFIVAQDYNGYHAWDATEVPPGDPAFSLAVPVEQYRTSYNFLAPSTYEQSYVNITTTDGSEASITLDGAGLPGASWEAVGDSGYTSARVAIDPGSHTMSSGSSAAFGITVYGYGAYTSYMFPGGLDLTPITVW